MATQTRQTRWVDTLRRLRRQRRIRSFATVGLVVLGPMLALATFLVLGPLDQGSNDLLLRLILLADVVYILVVAALVLSQVARIIAARRAQSAGSRLHLRLTAVFAALALFPTVIVAVFAMLTINIALEGWFSERVRNVVGFSLASAEAYEQEQREGLIEDARALAVSIDIARVQQVELSDSELLGEAQRQIQRGLREAYLVDGTATIRARGDRSYLFDFEPTDARQMAAARKNGLEIIQDWQINEFRALVPLRSFPDRFLYVTRDVDGEILSLLDETQKTVRLYQQLESDRGKRLFEFGLLISPLL